MANAEKLAQKAEASLDEAEKAMTALEPDAAQSAITDTRKAMAETDFGYYPERELLKCRVSKDEQVLLRVRVEVAKRELERRLTKQKANVDKRLVELRSALEVLRQPGLTMS